MAYTSREYFLIHKYMGVPVFGVNKDVFVSNAIISSQPHGDAAPCNIPGIGVTNGQDYTGQTELDVRDNLEMIDKYLLAIDSNMDVNIALEVDSQKISSRMSNEEYRRRIEELIINISTMINCPIYKPFFSTDINATRVHDIGRS